MVHVFVVGGPDMGQDLVIAASAGHAQRVDTRPWYSVIQQTMALVARVRSDKKIAKKPTRDSCR